MLPLLLPAVVGVLGAALTRLALRGRLPRLERPAARATALAAGGSPRICWSPRAPSRRPIAPWRPVG